MGSNNVQSDGFVGQADETTGSDAFNAQSFLVNQILQQKWTVCVVQVKSVTGGGPTSTPPTVSVQPLVNQVDGQGQATPHGVINGVPVVRMQGGNGAVVVDPLEGDIGIMLVASRDISAVKNTQAQANPGSSRTFDPADGIYLGGILNKTPGPYFQITKDQIVGQFNQGNGFTINAEGINFQGVNMSIKASSSGLALTAGSASITVNNNGSIALVGTDITLNGKVWDTHTHAVSTAPGETGGPVG
jgi:hypothetical protein